jgi:hypothetical protein
MKAPFPGALFFFAKDLAHLLDQRDMPPKCLLLKLFDLLTQLEKGNPTLGVAVSHGTVFHFKQKPGQIKEN